MIFQEDAYPQMESRRSRIADELLRTNKERLRVLYGEKVVICAIHHVFLGCLSSSSVRYEAMSRHHQLSKFCSHGH